MNILILLVTVPLVYGAGYILLQASGSAVIWIGSWGNRVLRIPQAQDKSMWLFSMLMGLTRTPTLVLGAAAYALYMLEYLQGDPLYTIAESFAILAFGTFLVIRLVCLLIGGVMFGDSIKGILRSLSS